MCQKWVFEVFSVVKNEMNWLAWINVWQAARLVALCLRLNSQQQLGKYSLIMKFDQRVNIFLLLMNICYLKVIRR